jgi:hypothetical protein
MATLRDAAGNPIHSDVVTPQPHTTPWFPNDQNRVTANDVDQMIHSRIHAAQAAQAAAMLDQARKDVRKDMYKNVGLGLGGFAVGVGGTLLIGRWRRNRAAQGR